MSAIARFNELQVVYATIQSMKGIYPEFYILFSFNYAVLNY